MRLGLPGFFNLAIVYFISARIGALGKNYPQNEIDNAFAKFIKKERFYKKLDEQLGCWPQNVIPFTIKEGFTPAQIQHIYRHIYQIQNRTCLRWVEKKTLSGVRKEVEFVHKGTDEFVCHTGEYRYPNKITSQITLGDLCFPTESVIHEMLHSLGFLHEHQRIDRDCYVIVDEKHARTDTDFKIIYDELTYEKWPYDKRSISHYSRLSYALKDKDEPFGGLLWKHRLGDSYGWWGAVGKRYGKLTCLDAFKINYRFCGAPDFCSTQPEICDNIEKEEKELGCKDLYMQIAKAIRESKSSGK